MKFLSSVDQDHLNARNNFHSYFQPQCLVSDNRHMCDYLNKCFFFSPEDVQSIISGKLGLKYSGPSVSIPWKVLADN